MKTFNFDYTINDYKERMSNVQSYLDELGDEQLELHKNYIENLGNYILFALDKELKHTKDGITPSQYNVLCDAQKGIKSRVDNRAERRSKVEYNRTDRNNRHIIEQLESLFLILDNIENYHELIKLATEKKMSANFKSTIYEDIAECKKGLNITEVRSKDDVNSQYDKLNEIEIDYTNHEIVKLLLRSLGDLSRANVYSTEHCIYMDLESAIKRAKLTSKQELAVNDYTNGLSTEYIDLTNLKFAINKIMKKLS